MTKFENLSKQMKDAIASLITKDSSTEVIKKVGDITKQIEELEAEHKTSLDENAELKEMIVNQVKNSSFKPNGQEEINEDKSIDDIMAEELNKITTKGN